MQPTTLHSPLLNSYINKNRPTQAETKGAAPLLNTLQTDNFSTSQQEQKEEETSFQKALKVIGVLSAAALVVGIIAAAVKKTDPSAAIDEGQKARTPLPKKPQNTPAPEAPHRITIHSIDPGEPIPIYKAFSIDRDYDKAKCLFKEITGATLHCPTPTDDFGGALVNLKVIQEMGNFPPNIKHVVMGHGFGSSLDNTWRFIGNGQNVFDYIDANIPKGEEVILMVCEETSQRVIGKAAIGTECNTSLIDKNKPAKIVRAGERRIIGQFLDPGCDYGDPNLKGLLYY